MTGEKAKRRKNESSIRAKVAASEAGDSDLEFEDPYGDDFEVEEEVLPSSRKSASRMKRNGAASPEPMAADGEDSASEEDGADVELENPSSDEDEGGKAATTRKLWRPGVDSLQEGEVLEFDSSAYEFFHKFSTSWPCLSFDVIPDGLGAVRSKCPHTCFLVGGTQASAASANVLYVMKCSRLHRTMFDEADSLPSNAVGKSFFLVDCKSDADEEEEEEDGDGEARLDFRLLKHDAVVNRVRVCPQLPRLVSVWSEAAVVSVFDIQAQLQRLQEPDSTGPPPNPHVSPKAQFSGHGVEGFAMDWNPIQVGRLQTGRLLTGDVEGAAYLWEPTEGGWTHRPLFGTPSDAKKKKKKATRVSLEELHWRGGEAASDSIFAAAFSNGDVQIFDLREGTTSPSLALPSLHASDVNAMRFSPCNEHLLLTGDEEGQLKVTDLRCPELPLVHLTWHRKPITSVSWNPSDEAVFAAASLDDSVSIWDLSVERDEQAEAETRKKAPMEEEEIPPQLMFLHSGQTHVSEIHFHRQIPGCLATTASDGFNIFKTCNI